MSAARPSSARPVRNWSTRRSPGTELLDGTTSRHGIHSVMEALAAGVVTEVLVTGVSRPQVGAVARKAAFVRVPVHEVSPGDLDRLSAGARHQGVVAIIRPHEYLPFDDLRVLVAMATNPPFIVALDGVEDPQNFGAVLRTAEGAGALAVLVSDRGTAPVTAAVARASAGAADRVPMTRVGSLPSTLNSLKRDGFEVVGLDGGAVERYDHADLRGRVVIVAGAEGRGLSRAVAQACDKLVRIPLHGAITSLNVSVAVAIVAFALQARRDRTNGQMESSSGITLSESDSTSSSASDIRVHELRAEAAD